MIPTLLLLLAASAADAGPRAPCRVSPWGPWSACDPHTGSRHRTRSVLRKAAGGGYCPPLYQKQPCPVDCTVSEWGPWLDCGVQSPSNETMVRLRNVTRWPANGGQQCPPIAEVQNCPMDCELSDWSPWTPCDNYTGLISSNRTVVRDASYGGAPCTGPTYIEVTCRVNCSVSDWTPWSMCGVDKTQYRSRQVIYDARSRGTPCPPLNETQPCSQGCGQQLLSFDCKLDNSKNTTSCNNGTISATVQSKPGYSYANVSISARISNYTRDANETVSIPRPDLGPCGYVVGHSLCRMDPLSPTTECSYSGIPFTLPYTQGYPLVLVEVVAKPTEYKKA